MCRCCYCCSCVGHGGHRWWCYLGVALLVLLIPVQGVLQVWLMRYRADVNKLTDKVRQTGREGGRTRRTSVALISGLLDLTHDMAPPLLVSWAAAAAVPAPLSASSSPTRSCKVPLTTYHLPTLARHDTGVRQQSVTSSYY